MSASKKHAFTAIGSQYVVNPFQVSRACANGKTGHHIKTIPEKRRNKPLPVSTRACVVGKESAVRGAADAVLRQEHTMAPRNDAKPLPATERRRGCEPHDGIERRQLIRYELQCEPRRKNCDRRVNCGWDDIPLR